MALTINNIITNEDFNTLRTAIINECQRRNHVNPLPVPTVSEKNDNDSITYNDVNDLLSSLVSLDAFPDTLDDVYIQTNNIDQIVILKNFQYNIIKALQVLHNVVKTAAATTTLVNNTDCRGNCAGLCTGCVGTCTSCSGTCSGTCSGCTSCSGGCTGSCQGCGGGCTGSCKTGCSGCGNCGGCDNGCSYSCKNCGGNDDGDVCSGYKCNCGTGGCAFSSS